MILNVDSIKFGIVANIASIVAQIEMSIAIKVAICARKPTRVRGDAGQQGLPGGTQAAQTTTTAQRARPLDRPFTLVVPPREFESLLPP